MFKIKGFFPYILMVFLNSFVDLGHKILLQNTFYLTQGGAHYAVYSACLNALILLPYLLLFTPSGFIADKFSKQQVLQWTAFAAIPLTLLVAWCYYHGAVRLAFLMTLVLAIQSVFNSPAKYGYIKEVFGKANIARANAFVQSTVIVAILSSSLVFSICFDFLIKRQGLNHQATPGELMVAFAPVGIILVVLAMIEFGCTWCMPRKSAVDPSSNYSVPLYFRGYYLVRYLQEMTRSPVVLLSILGLSLFWGINQVLLASYGAYLKDFAGNPSPVFVQAALAMGVVGILLGASYAGKVSHGFIESGMIPFAAIGISVGLFCLPYIVHHTLIMIFFFIYGFFGGMLIVPLNALIQFNADDRRLGKVMAATNFVQNVFMMTFLLANIVFSWAGGNIRYFMFALFGCAFVATFYSLVSLPQSMLRFFLYFLVTKFYRIRVDGLDHMPSTGGVLLLGNHTSYLDWALIQIASPRSVRFVMERSIYQRWYLRWVLKSLRMIPISRGGSRQSLEEIRDALNAGEVVALFPEGRLSRNGQIGRFTSGYERAVVGTDAVIMPFYLRGLWGSVSSHASSHYKKISRVRQRRISITFGAPMPISANASMVKQQVTQLSIAAWQNFVGDLATIPQEWLRRVKQLPAEKSVIDSMGVTLTNAELLSTVMYVQKGLKPKLQGQERVGILLPPGAAGIIANLAVMTLGKTVVNLNYTAGEKAIASAVEQANIKTVITAERFLDRLLQKGYHVRPALSECSLCYFERFKKPTGKLFIVKNFVLVSLLPSFLLKAFFIKRRKNTDTAAILFSSGSEGAPKGVELSHQNILGNAKQISSVFNIQGDDRVCCTLPLFHAFGFTATTIMPLVGGIPVVCHADPTDVLAISKLAFNHKVTFMCGTSTLFQLFCRNPKILPQMLSTVRLVVSGAEKLSTIVAERFKEKFNLDIYEGYGITEVAPVASSNLPDILDSSDWHLARYRKFGTVGLPLPGTAFKVVDHETFELLPMGEAGMVLIGGPQVMKGYLNQEDKTQSVLLKQDNIRWYITQDKGYLDEDGYLTIVDRYSRFAKIGGEMVSLGAVEQALMSVLSHQEEVDVAAVAVSDERKGERVVVIYTGTVDTVWLRSELLARGVSPLWLPAQYLSVSVMPKLGSGKKDYQQARKIALMMLDGE